jgi:adenylate cyclase
VLLRWLNQRRSLGSVIAAWREVLPGDSDFGDPLSTVGSAPARVLARQAWSASNQGQFSALAEAGLAVLQVADWVGEDLRPGGFDDDVAILFTDLVGFSTWALDAGDRDSLKTLRSVDAVVTSVVTEHGGEVVKRLGDGTMAVFEDCPGAFEAAKDAITAGRDVGADGYEPRLRAGLHFGAPQPIAGDFIGVDVNVAARLCEAAAADEILVSEAILEGLDGDRPKLRSRSARELDGVPPELGLYSYQLEDTRANARASR